MARTLVTIIFMLICLVMIIVVMMQESKNSGFQIEAALEDADTDRLILILMLERTVVGLKKVSWRELQQFLDFYSL